jgi:hypothetical protein
MTVTAMVSMVTSVMMFMPARTTTTLEAMWAIHGNIVVCTSLRITGRLAISYREAKEGIRPFTATERTDVLLILFFWVSFHTNENAGKRSAWRLGKEKTGEEIRGTNRKDADKLFVDLIVGGKGRIREGELAGFWAISGFNGEHDSREGTSTGRWCPL